MRTICEVSCSTSGSCTAFSGVDKVQETELSEDVDLLGELVKAGNAAKLGGRPSEKLESTVRKLHAVSSGPVRVAGVGPGA